MKPPPFLLGAALLFWGWQTGFVVIGAVMAVVLESGRWVKARWEVSEDDFNRIWTFCAVLLLAVGVYAFTSNQGAAEMRDFLQHPGFLSQRNVGTATSRAAAAWLRWLPMVFFLFVAAQQFSSREAVPLVSISLLARRRRNQARRLGQPAPASRMINVCYPYFALCLFAASIHSNETPGFFWGVCALLAWVLWSQRSRRFAPVVWAAALAVAIALGYAGQQGVSQLQRYIDNLNSQWFARFSRHGFDPGQSRTSLGQIGRLKASGKIVIRLENKLGPPPTLLREASYRAYKAQTWYSETSDADFQRVSETPPNTGAYLLQPEKSHPAALHIACYLDGRKGLLPLPRGAARLENLWVISLDKSSLGAVMADGPGLAIFDARYGPGATIDAPGNTNEDLAVPPREIPALDRVMSELHLAGLPPEQVLRRVNEFFLDKFHYSTWQGPPGKGFTTNHLRGTHFVLENGVANRSHTNAEETPLGRFLLQTRSGHCEYFATATVLLLRRAGIPARYAVGYAVHEGAGGKYVVRQRDAHAWCLAWDQASGTWRDFDTTPGSWVEEEAARASALQFLSDFWSRIGFEFSKLRWGQTHLRQYLLWALLPVLALLLWQILFRTRRRRLRGKPSGAELALAWAGLDSEFYRLEEQLGRRGVPRRPSEPLSEWLLRALAEPALVELKAPLQQLLALHYRYRFDPQGLTPQERHTLRHEARACLTKVSAET